MITLRDEQTARKLATKVGMALRRSGNLYALVDAGTNGVVFGIGSNGKPNATIGQVLEWLASPPK